MSIYLSTVAPTIEFEARNVSVIESDGSVTVNLVRTGNHSNNITVCIIVIRVENPAIVECTYSCAHIIRMKFVFICCRSFYKILFLLMFIHSCNKCDGSISEYFTI